MSALCPDLLRRAAAIGREGCAMALCLIVSDRGSTPQSAGAVMFIDELGRLHGTIGGGCIEAEVRRRAMPLLAERRSACYRLRLDGDYGWDDGLICGGTIEVAVAPAPPPEVLEQIASDIERGHPTRLDVEIGSGAARERITLHLPPRCRLYIAGAGHIGQAVAVLAAALDFDVTIFDDRPDLLARFAPPMRTVCGPIAARLDEAPMDQQTYCLIVTRGHRHDAQALAAVLSRGCEDDVNAIPPNAEGKAPTDRPGPPWPLASSPHPCYVGMIGSRRKVAVTFEDLESRGVPRERLESVCAPVGLPIGAQSVEEIALSIAAQLVQVRAAARRGKEAHHRNLIERVIIAPPSASLSRTPIGVLLAAGRSQRMGRTKQTLPLPADPASRSLAAAAFDAIAADCNQMVVVMAHEARAVEESLGERRYQTAVAPPGAEMFESVLAGLREAARLDPAAPVLLHLADHPHVSARTLAAMRQAAQEHPDRAIMPTFDGQGGHPVLIPASLVGEILGQADSLQSGSLREFWAANPQRCLRLPVDDPSILVDIDVPGDYRRLLQGVS